MDQAVEAAIAAFPARIHHVARRWAHETPSRPALSDGVRHWSWADLGTAIDAAVAVLREAGVRGGDRVLLVNENCLELVALIFASSELDAWPVIVNARLSGPEIEAISRHCRPRCAIFTTAISAEAASHAARIGAVSRDVPALGTITVGAIDPDTVPEPVSADNSEQVGALIYTSGTTGTPKGVMLTHRNLFHIAVFSGRLRGLHMTDRVCGVLPISHVFGLASMFLGTMYAGGMLRVMPRFDADALLDIAINERLSVLQGVPAMYAKLIERAKATGRTLRGAALRYMSSGGSPLDLAVKAGMEALTGAVLHNGYGLTEAAPTVTQTRLDAPRQDDSIGPALTGVELRFVDSAGRDVPDGEIGELWLRGPNVMKGYYRDPELTQRTITADGWLKTGDLCRIDPDGAVFLVGRAKELIIRSGFNVYPAEVEAAFNTHPAVTQCAVIGRKVPGNEEVIAFVQVAPGTNVTEPELRAHATQRLAPYKVPAHIVVMASLPASSTGKILKSRLADMALQLGDGAAAMT
jgi:acyl-CoA synthetase (AMP-forming)/AMP-acid ligase II